MYFRCPNGHSNRFTGKKSQISKGTTFKCRVCDETVIVGKKSNGKFFQPFSHPVSRVFS